MVFAIGGTKLYYAYYTSEGEDVVMEGFALSKSPFFLHYHSADDGWLTGLSDKQQLLLRTTDAGDSWRVWEVEGLPQSETYEGAFFADEDHGWLLTSRSSHRRSSLTGGLYATRDGGRSWTRSATMPSGSILTVEVASSESLIVVTENAAARSSDGGNTLQLLHFEGFRATAAAVAPGETVWVVGHPESNDVYEVHWRRFSNDTWHTFNPEEGARTLSVAAPTENHVYILGNSVWRTSTGGPPFELVPFQPQGSMFRTGFTDHDSGWTLEVSREEGFNFTEIVHQRLLSTDDGGESWSMDAEVPSAWTPVISHGVEDRPMLFSHSKVGPNLRLRKHDGLWWGVF